MSLDKFVGFIPKEQKENAPLAEKLAGGLLAQRCSNCGKKTMYLPRNEGVEFRFLCNACRAREFKMMKEEEKALFK